MRNQIPHDFFESWHRAHFELLEAADIRNGENGSPIHNSHHLLSLVRKVAKLELQAMKNNWPRLHRVQYPDDRICREELPGNKPLPLSRVAITLEFRRLCLQLQHHVSLPRKRYYLFVRMQDLLNALDLPPCEDVFEGTPSLPEYESDEDHPSYETDDASDSDEGDNEDDDDQEQGEDVPFGIPEPDLHPHVELCRQRFTSHRGGNVWEYFDRIFPCKLFMDMIFRSIDDGDIGTTLSNLRTGGGSTQSQKTQELPVAAICVYFRRCTAIVTTDTVPSRDGLISKIKETFTRFEVTFEGLPQSECTRLELEAPYLPPRGNKELVQEILIPKHIIGGQANVTEVANRLKRSGGMLVVATNSWSAGGQLDFAYEVVCSLEPERPYFLFQDEADRDFRTPNQGMLVEQKIENLCTRTGRRCAGRMLITATLIAPIYFMLRQKRRNQAVGGEDSCFAPGHNVFFTKPGNDYVSHR